MIPLILLGILCLGFTEMRTWHEPSFALWRPYHEPDSAIHFLYTGPFGFLIGGIAGIVYWSELKHEPTSSKTEIQEENHGSKTRA